MSAQAPEQAGEFLDGNKPPGFFITRQDGELEKRYGYHAFNRSATLLVWQIFFLFRAFFQVLPAFCAFWLLREQ